MVQVSRPASVATQQQRSGLGSSSATVNLARGTSSGFGATTSAVRVPSSGYGGTTRYTLEGTRYADPQFDDMGRPIDVVVEMVGPSRARRQAIAAQAASRADAAAQRAVAVKAPPRETALWPAPPPMPASSITVSAPASPPRARQSVSVGSDRGGSISPNNGNLPSSPFAVGAEHLGAAASAGNPPSLSRGGSFLVPGGEGRNISVGARSEAGFSVGRSVPGGNARGTVEMGFDSKWSHDTRTPSPPYDTQVTKHKGSPARH
jgi:hypothetical protein